MPTHAIARLNILDTLNIHGEMDIESIAKRTGYSTQVILMILTIEELKGNVSCRCQGRSMFYRVAFEPSEMSGIRRASDIRRYHERGKI